MARIPSLQKLRSVWEPKKLVKAVSNQLLVNNTVVHYINTNQFLDIDFDDSYDVTPFTSDTYYIDTRKDETLISEFQPFMTDTTNNLQGLSPIVKTDAQKEALKTMRLKFRYP